MAGVGTSSGGAFTPPDLSVGVPVTINGGTLGGLALGAGEVLYDKLFEAPPYMYCLFGGSTLPAGLTLDPATGIISGTPTTAGVFFTMLTVMPAALPTYGNSWLGTGGGSGPSSPPTPCWGQIGAGSRWVGFVWYVGVTSGSLTAQTVAPLPTISNRFYASEWSGNSFSITLPTASSGLTTTLQVLSGPATASGNTITITGRGDIVLACGQAGNGTYAPALPVLTTFSVVQPSVEISSLFQPYNGSPHPVVITTNPSGLATGVTYNGNTTAPTAVGIYDVVATITDGSAPSGISSEATLEVLELIGGTPFQVPCGLLLVNLDTITVNQTPAPLFFKKGDDIFVAVQFNNVLVGSTPTTHLYAVASDLKLQICETPNGEVILESDTFIGGVDTASNPFYLVHISAAGAGLLAAIFDSFADTGTTATLHGRLVWNARNTSGVGPTILPQSTPVFPIAIGNNVQ